MNVAELWLYRIKGRVFYRQVLKTLGRKSAIYPPMLIGRPMFIHIGKRVTIRKGVRLEAFLRTRTTPLRSESAMMSVFRKTYVSTVGKIYVHDNVCIAARSALLGTGHPFVDIKSPIKIGDRVEGERCIIEIGESSFLGLGSVIQMNVELGNMW
jgi:UDP-3-O-[3-hydroxymyristoyl] glucosamine N-acyltransferase